MSWRDGLLRILGAPMSMREPMVQMDPDESSVLSMLMPRHATAAADRGTQGMLKAYSTSPWVRSAMAKIADVAGPTRWYLFAYRSRSGKYVKHSRLQTRRDGSTKGLSRAADIFQDGEVMEVLDHPFLRLMEGSNPVYPGHIGLGLTFTCIDLTGEAFWLFDPLESEAMVPESYWIIPPHWVTEMPTTSKPYWTIQGPNLKLDVPTTGMLRFVNPNPYDPYRRGSGHMRAFGDEIDVFEFASKHIRAFFQNRAIPDVLIYGTNIDRKDSERFQQNWVSKLRGFTRAHKPMFLKAKDITVKELSQKFTDMELSKLKKDERDTIIHGLGIPPEIFGILESSNRSTIDAADYFFTKNVIIPRLELMRAFLQTFLLPHYDERLILAYESPVAEDREFKLEVLKGSPVTRVNDWRELAEMELVDEAEDVWIVPFNVQLRASLDPDPLPALEPGAASLPAAATKDGCTPVPNPYSQDEAPCSCGQGHLAGDAMPRSLKSAINRAVGGEQVSGLALKLSKEMQKAVIEAWLAIRNEVDLRQLEAVLESGNWTSLLNQLDEAGVAAYEDAVATLQQAVAVVGEASASALAEFLNVNLSFELTNPEAVAALERLGADMVTNVSDETIVALREALTDAYRNGKTGSKVAKEIRDLIGLTRRDVIALGKLEADLAAQVEAGEITQAQADKFLDKWTKAKIRYRAQVIAEHELNRAGNMGQQMLWNQAEAEGLMPKTARREWVVTPDDRLCVLCAPMAGQQVAIGQPYTATTGAMIMTPQDIHVRCRCSQRLVFLNQ
jgi:hypothetical protein